MKSLRYKQRLFETLLFILLLLPVISFFLYATTGLFFNFNNFNFIIYLLYIVLFLISIKRVEKGVAKFLRLFFFVLTINLAGHIINQGGEGIIDFLRTISGYYIFVIIGVLMYLLYYKQNNTNRLLKIITKSGAFIAVINLCHYIYIVSDDYIHADWSIQFNHYQLMVDYLYELNKSFFDYILIGLNYDHILRPVGFFYDTHSQFYVPLASSIILLYNRNLMKHSLFWICIMFSAILLSSIKTAILIIFILSVIWIFLKTNIKTFVKFVIPLSLCVLFVFKNIIFTMLMGDNLIKIIFQLFNHLIFVPLNFFSTNIVGFFIGGTSFLRDNPSFYSEIFWVTVTFYIGLIGLIIYLKPMGLLKEIRSPDRSLSAYIYLIFVLSLTHYGVYAVGINNIVSALPIMYHLAYYNKKQLSHKQNNPLSPHCKKMNFHKRDKEFANFYSEEKL